MLSRSFARRTVSSILVRESRTSVICHAFNSSTTNVRSDMMKKVRSHNHPVTTENRATRKGDKSFPDIRLRNIVSSKADGIIPVKPTFGPAFDVLQKREFSIQRIKKITGNDRTNIVPSNLYDTIHHPSFRCRNLRERRRSIQEVLRWFCQGREGLAIGLTI